MLAELFLSLVVILLELRLCYYGFPITQFSYTPESGLRRHALAQYVQNIARRLGSLCNYADILIQPPAGAIQACMLQFPATVAEELIATQTAAVVGSTMGF